MQPISVLAPYLPTTLHRKRDAARLKIGEIFKDIISKRRASGVKGNDILQTFIDGKYERAYGGRPLTESEITGLLIAALFAGMHTSTITSAWTGLFLSAHRASWDACVEEQRRIVAEHGQDLNVEVLGNMEVLHACITEALRMYPPLIMMLRYAKQPFTVTGNAPLLLLIVHKPALLHAFPVHAPICCFCRCYSSAIFAECRLQREAVLCSKGRHLRYVPERTAPRGQYLPES